VPARLIDRAAEIDPGWFRGDETVLLTAGASAPELIVEDCVEFLRKRFGATVESHSVRHEDVHFPLPKPLRAAAVP
jgi:4-hydroxy-3-methylbut-2-enyl diphosphate reductase